MVEGQHTHMLEAQGRQMGPNRSCLGFPRHSQQERGLQQRLAAHQENVVTEQFAACVAANQLLEQVLPGGGLCVVWCVVSCTLMIVLGLVS